MKKLIVILFIIFGAFLTFSLYRTFAYDTSVVEEVPSTTDLEYTFKIGNSSIKQITVDSGETRYYDIVLGNPNNAKISYSVYYEMVSPSTKPDGFSIEYTKKSTGESTGKVDKEGNITLNLVVTNTSSSAVTVKIGSVAGYVNGGELILGSGQTLIPEKIFPVIATKYVMGLNDRTTGDSGSGVYKVSHKTIDDYRYYGDSPNNYICLDMENGSACPDRHLYRIIGSIFEDKDRTNRLKVIKATPLTNGTTNKFSWDYNSSGGSNIWATVTSGDYSDSLTDGAVLMKLLNSGDWWSSTNTYVNYGLTETAKSMVNISRYYLGGYDMYNTPPAYVMYEYERGTARYDTNRPLYWDGMVGLMYPSDYGYAAGNDCATNTSISNYDRGCYQKDWINDLSNDQWTMMPYSTSGNFVYRLFSRGIITSDGQVDFGSVVRPVFYLKSSVSISSGDGSINNPYILE